MMREAVPLERKMLYYSTHHVLFLQLRICHLSFVESPPGMEVLQLGTVQMVVVAAWTLGMICLEVQVGLQEGY